jgi:hypothetical protein
MEPRWNRNGAAMEPRWNRNGAAMEPRWSREVHRDKAAMEPRYIPPGLASYVLVTVYIVANKTYGKLETLHKKYMKCHHSPHDFPNYGMSRQLHKNKLREQRFMIKVHVAG